MENDFQTMKCAKLWKSRFQVIPEKFPKYFHSMENVQFFQFIQRTKCRSRLAPSPAGLRPTAGRAERGDYMAQVCSIYYFNGPYTLKGTEA